MDVEKYTVIDSDGVETNWWTDFYPEARKFAREISGATIAYTFEFADSEMVDDFRSAKTYECATCGVLVTDEEPHKHLEGWHGKS